MRGDIVIQAGAGRQFLRFSRPRAIISASALDDVRASLGAVERAVEREGLHAAGFISYEAAPAFDAACAVRPAGDLPLLWFGLYEKPEQLAELRDAAGRDYDLGPWEPLIEVAAYRQAIGRIKDFIAAGDTYQVNFTFPLQTEFAGDPWALFRRLAAAQRGHYAAYVDTGRYAICSASPELFFSLDGERLAGRPMKGTAARGRSLAEDEATAIRLGNSEKDRAENVMTVDMIRNDMGRIARFASVHVSGLFDVERYPTLWQMTSTVECRTPVALTEIMAALFPCASITGAPKVRTMQIIAGLEQAPRGVYTGCIGYLAPGRQAQFNVAIRTVVVDREAGQATYGVGSGIVWDSDADAEYQECRVKARVLAAAPPDFDLLETLLWTPGEGFFLLDEHLRRLADSAEYFAVPLDQAALREGLARLAAGLPIQPHKVRLLLAQEGKWRLECQSLPAAEPGRPLRVGLSVKPVDSAVPFLYHKTTRREVYEAARRSRPDCDDVLLWNQRGELTESSIANLVVELDGELVTPPLESGLLPGIFRQRLLDSGGVRERVVLRDDLARCSQVFLVNSVRKWREAVFVD